jgi:plasmid stabilization system protein ParE
MIVESIPSFPFVGRKVPELNIENIRERLYKSYRIVYRIKPASIEIVAIVHSARLFRRR